MANFDESRYIVKARVKKEYCENVTEQWVQGCLVIANDMNYGNRYRIQPTAGHYRFAFPIDPETICKPTGQKDKNNALIFEHDLCKLNDEYVDEDEIFEVLWDEENARYILKGEHSQYNFVTSYGPDFEVVGNVFDKQKIQKDAERTLFVEDKDKTEIAAWLKSNANNEINKHKVLFHIGDEVCYACNNYFATQKIIKITIDEDGVTYMTNVPRLFTNADIGKEIFKSFDDAKQYSIKEKDRMEYER